MAEQLKCCGNCCKWKVARHYECQHAGYYGGDLLHEAYCKWEPLDPKKLPLFQENNGRFKHYVIRWTPRDNKRIRDSWEWSQFTLPNKRWRWVDYKEVCKELKKARKKFPEHIFKMVKIEEKQTYLRI